MNCATRSLGGTRQHLHLANGEGPDPGQAALPFRTYARKRETERAAAELAEAHRLDGGNLSTSIARVEARIWQGVPKIRALYETTYFAGLRKAGMPEE